MIDFDVVTGSGPSQPPEKAAALPAAPALQPPRAAPTPAAGAGIVDPAPKAQRPAEP